MNVNSKHIIRLFFILITSITQAQETIDANNPNNFVTGGGQESHDFSLNILPVSIIDIEGFTGLNSGVDNTVLEAGLAVTGGTTDVSNIWLNYTYRALNSNSARIFVSTNQPVPAGVTLKVRIENNNYGNGGDFIKTPRIEDVTLSQIAQVLVYDFGNGYTGNGEGNGYHVIYAITNPNGVSFPDGFEILYKIQ